MQRLLIATTNPAKLAEYRLILRDVGIELELVSLADVGISQAPEETGATFAANALLKILEEPPRHALLLLVAHSVGKLLPTIRSRCRQVKLSTLPPANN